MLFREICLAPRPHVRHLLHEPVYPCRGKRNGALNLYIVIPLSPNPCFPKQTHVYCFLGGLHSVAATMWIQIRTIDGKETRTIEDLSRLTKIESLRLKIQEIFHVNPEQQRLFYRGKQVMELYLVTQGHWPIDFVHLYDLVLGWLWLCVEHRFKPKLPVLIGIR
jgi:hypothetical protein